MRNRALFISLAVILLAAAVLVGLYFVLWNTPEPSTQISIQSNPIDIQTLNKDERPITDGIRLLKPKSQPLIKVILSEDVQKDPALRTASIIDFEGVADKNVESVTLTSKCYGEFGMGTGTVLRPEGVASAWKWTISIGTSQICRGENLISIRPSTCDKPSNQQPFFEGDTGPKVCWLITRLVFDSDVAPIHPQTIALTSPKPDDPSVAEKPSVTFEGVAGKEVEKVRVTTACRPSIWRKGFANVIERPKGTKSDWKWSFVLPEGTDGVCKGDNYVDFNPSTCNTDGYSDACRLRTAYSFISNAGFLDSMDMKFFQSPYRARENEYFLSSKTVTLNGMAGSDISTIDVNLRCNDADIDHKDTISKPTSGIRSDGSWEWSYTLDADNQTLCRGGNGLTFTPYVFGQKEENRSFGFFSEVGYMPPKLKERVDGITQYATHTIKDIDDVKEDKSIVTALSSTNTQYNAVCAEDNFGMGMDDATEKLESAPKELMAPKKLDAHLSVLLRLPTEEEQKDWKGAGLGAYGTTPVVEFVSDDGSSVPPPLFGWACNGSATIYYLRPDRILVNLGQGHESSTVYYLWDGKEWKNLGSIVPVHNPINLKIVNKKMFVAEETSACCDIFYPTVPGEWAQFIYDFDTLKIIDVLFRSDSQYY